MANELDLIKKAAEHAAAELGIDVDYQSFDDAEAYMNEGVKPKMKRPIMTVEARDALNAMCDAEQSRNLFDKTRSELIIDMANSRIALLNEVIELNDINTKHVNRMEKDLRILKSAKAFASSSIKSRNYWLKVAGVSIVINWAFLIYTAIEQGWLL